MDKLILQKKLITAVLLIFSFNTPLVLAQTSLSMQQAIERALLDDEWLIANQYTESSLREEAEFAGQLPDPTMSVALANIPVDSWNFGQEAMTQFKVGIKQTFPRGDVLELGQQQKTQQSEINPFLREDRRANVALQVAHLWLESFLAQESITLIQQDRDLFEQLVDVTDSRYRTGSGPARQLDVVRAELELTRLDDRLATLKQRLDNNKQQLAQWLPYEWLSLQIAPNLPDLRSPEIVLNSLAQAAQAFSQHPKVLAMDKQIEVAFTGVEIAKQSHKSAFTVGASYGYRDNDPMGRSRSDFVSIDVSFDLPIFGEKRQEPKVRAASYKAAATQTNRSLLFKSLFANYQQAMSQLSVLDERKVFYRDVLLPQISDLTEATLTAYTADEGSFEEVMRAYIGELDTRIETLGVEVERLKILSRLNYLLSSVAN